MTPGGRLAVALRDRMPAWTARALPATAVDVAELRHPSYGWSVTITARAVATVYVAGRIVAELYALDPAPIVAMLDAMERQHAAHLDRFAGHTLAEFEAERPARPSDSVDDESTRRPVVVYGGTVSGLMPHLGRAA